MAERELSDEAVIGVYAHRAVRFRVGFSAFVAVVLLDSAGISAGWLSGRGMGLIIVITAVLGLLALWWYLRRCPRCKAFFANSLGNLTTCSACGARLLPPAA